MQKKRIEGGEGGLDKETREKLKQLRFLYKYKIGRGLKTNAEYKAERRKLLKVSRTQEALYWIDGFNKWMAKKKDSKHNRSFYKRMYEDTLKKKKPQAKLDKFISQKDY